MENKIMKKKTMSFLLRDKSLAHALALKQQREREVGKGISIVEIVREAVTEKYMRDITEGEK